MSFKFPKFTVSSKPYYLLLLPVFFVLHGFLEHLFLISYADALVLLLSYIGAASLVFLGYNFLFKNISKAALATFIAFFICFFFGAIHDFLKQFLPSLLSRYIFLLPVLCLFYLSLLFLLKKKNPGQKISTYLNIVFAILIIIDLGTLVWKTTHEKKQNFSITEKPGMIKPDIYLLLLDEYSGDEQLEHIFHFNNNVFFDSLSALGFKIAKNSTSNYSSTPFSMASLLSMSFHPELKNFEYTDKNLNYCFRKISLSDVVSGFKSIGYRFVNYSIFDFKAESSVIDKTFLKSGTQLITAQTLWSRVRKDLLDNFIVNHLQWSSLFEDLVMKDFKNNELLYQKTIDEALHSSTQPRFIYTHLLMPHYPYYFKAGGELNNKETMIGSENMYNQQLYIGYLQYVNRRVIHLMNQIIQSDKEAIILLLSDHGYRYANDNHFIFSTISAIYDAKGLVNFNKISPSNVNVFRSLFNDLFQTRLALLPDKHFR